MQHQDVLQLTDDCFRPRVSQDSKFTAIWLADRLSAEGVRIDPDVLEAVMIISTKICDVRPLRPSCAAVVRAERSVCSLLDFRFFFQPPLSRAYEQLGCDESATRHVEELLDALLSEVARGRAVLPKAWSEDLADRVVSWVRVRGPHDTLGFLSSFAGRASSSSRRKRVRAPAPACEQDVVDLCCYECM